VAEIRRVLSEEFFLRDLEETPIAICSKRLRIGAAAGCGPLQGGDALEVGELTVGNDRRCARQNWAADLVSILAGSEIIQGTRSPGHQPLQLPQTPRSARQIMESSLINEKRP
jgi:hypothetical protein